MHTPRLLACTMLVVAGSVAAASLPATTQTSIGLFYQPGAPRTATLWQPGDAGTRLELRGRVLSTRGAPIAGALVELWHADATGSVDESRYRAALRTDAGGQFMIRTVLPGHIEMARGNAVFAARHVHIVVTHPAYARLVSLIYFKGDERLANAAYPELAITLDEAGADEQMFLFGIAQIVLRDRD